MNRHVFFTTVILCASMLRTSVCILLPPSLLTYYILVTVALITCDLGVMLEITGGASATALAFIFPAACYLQLSDPSARWYSRTKLPAIVCATFGVIVMTLSLILALGKVWGPEGAAKMCV